MCTGVVEPGIPIEEAKRIANTVHQRFHQETHPGYCVIHVGADQAAVES